MPKQPRTEGLLLFDAPFPLRRAIKDLGGEPERDAEDKFVAWRMPNRQALAQALEMSQNYKPQPQSGARAPTEAPAPTARPRARAAGGSFVGTFCAPPRSGARSGFASAFCAPPPSSAAAGRPASRRDFALAVETSLSMPTGPLHCARGHRFRLEGAHQDGHGVWCPECGESAHSGAQDQCTLCARAGVRPARRGEARSVEEMEFMEAMDGQLQFMDQDARYLQEERQRATRGTPRPGRRRT